MKLVVHRYLLTYVLCGNRNRYEVKLFMAEYVADEALNLLALEAGQRQIKDT